MTIATAPSRLSYNGDDSTTDFPITWKYIQKSHVVATLRGTDDSETVWVLNTDFTLTDANVDAGGTLTATTPPATGETLIIDLSVPYTQDFALPLGGPFPSVTVEKMADIAVQLAAQNNVKLNRAIVVPTSDSQVGSLELPIDSARASKAFHFDSSGAPTMVTPTDASGTAVTATGSTTSRELAERFAEVINVKDFGAKGDGSTDDTAAIQAAIDFADVGDVIYFPDAASRYIVSSTLDVDGAGTLTFRGTGMRQRTIQVADHTFTIFNVQSSNITFENMGFIGLANSGSGVWTINAANTGASLGLQVRNVEMSTIVGGIKNAQDDMLLDNVTIKLLKASAGIGVQILGTTSSDKPGIQHLRRVLVQNGVGSDCFAGLDIQNSGEILLEQCLFLSTGIGIRFAPGAGQGIKSFSAQNSACDSCSGAGVSVVPTSTGVAYRLRFHNHWSCSNNRGYLIGGASANVSGVQIVGGVILGNTNDGVLLNGTSVGDGNMDAQIVGAAIAGNANGVNVAAGAKGFQIVGNRIGDWADFGGNTNDGIVIQPGASNNYIISGNDLRGNGGNTITDGGTGATKLIRDNLGTSEGGRRLVPNVFVGSVAYSSLGTAVNHVAGTTYVAEVELNLAKTVNGIAVLNGGTVGTNKRIVAIYSRLGGAALANSALAGITSSGANSFQSHNFTSSIILQAGRYFVAVQADGNTDNARMVAANTFRQTTTSVSGSFGTLPSLTAPTTFTADVGPIVELY